jgi:tetratricopeptide (TPR) repeat protein
MTGPIFYVAVFGLWWGLPLEAQPSQCADNHASAELNAGVRAFKNAQYPLAVSHFKAATEADEDCTIARLYLGTAYMQQYIPGADSPENLQMATTAREQFEAVLEQQPENELAMASIASLGFNQKNFDEAETWYKRLTLVNPKNKEAFYTMGVIAWTRALQPIMDARQKLGMKPDDPAPIKDDVVRQEVRAKVLTVVQGGMDNLEHALAVDAEYDDAMAYMNLLWRQKADLEDSPEEARADLAKANEWFLKVINIRKAKAERKP